MSQSSGKPTVIKVGDGRGFVVEDQRGTRVVITARLPQLPPAHPWSNDEERTYSSLLGPLKGKPRIAAGCQFSIRVINVVDAGWLGGSSDRWSARV